MVPGGMSAPDQIRVLILASLLAGCGQQDAVDLFVDVRTDVRPEYEFASVRIELVGAGSAGPGRVQRPATAAEEAAFREGMRVAEFEEVDRPLVSVRVALLDALGLPVLERAAAVRIGERDRIVTVLLTRDCAGVICPGPGDDPSLEACLGGRCVDARCTPETPEHCPRGCDDDSDCAVEASCATGRCDEGTCFRVERTNACNEGQWCHPETGCVAIPDVVDAGMSLDAGMDAAVAFDAGTDAAVALDAGTDAPTAPCGDGECSGGEDACSCPADCGTGCGTWGIAVRLDVLSDPELREDDPTLTADMLEIYYNLTPMSGPTELWRSTRTRATDPWSPPEPVSEINMLYSTTNADIAPDGLTLYFNSYVSGSYDTFVSTRASREDPWGTPSPVPELNTSEDELSGSVDATHTRLVLQHRDSSSMPYDIYESVRPSASDPWGMPQLIPEVSSSYVDASPFLTTNGLELYFESWGTLRGIFVARRPALDEPFGAPEHLGALDSPDTNGDPWVSPDGRLMVFMSNRTGNSDLYQVTR